MYRAADRAASRSTPGRGRVRDAGRNPDGMANVIRVKASARPAESAGENTGAGASNRTGTAGAGTAGVEEIGAHGRPRSATPGGGGGGPGRGSGSDWVEVRTKLGREPTPSGACIDRRSAKTAHGGAEVGVDGGEMARGWKRHIVTDTLGLLLVVLVTAANWDDRTTARKLLTELRAEALPRLSVVWADWKNHNDTLTTRPRTPGWDWVGHRR